VNNIQLPPGNNGAPNANPTGAASNPTQAALIHRLCAQAGITIQQFQTMNPQQQQAFLSNQASIMRQNVTRQGAMNGGTPNPQGASTPGIMARPLPQQSAQGSPAIPGLQSGLNLNGAGQASAPTPAQAAALAVAASNNPALQARLMQMRAQGQPIPPALQNQLAAAVAAQNGQGNGQATGQGGMMNQAGQMGGNPVNPMMNSQSPRPPSESLPGMPNQGQGAGQNAGAGNPGAFNGQTPANQKQYQDVHNILLNLPEFMKMKEENRLSDSQKQMVCPKISW
jgi:hypothetical protein